MSQIKLIDETGAPLPANINIRFAVGTGDSDSAIFDVKSDGAGTQGWPIPFWPAQDYTLHVNKREVNPAYGEAERYVPARPSGIYGDEVITVPRTGQPPEPPPSSSVMGRLHLNGNGLFDANGRRVMLKGADAFCAFEIWLRFGPDSLKPVFAELRDTYRASAIRVWSMSVNLQANEFQRPPFDPRTFANYYAALSGFNAFCASYGLYVYWGIFPDVQLISSDVGWQQTHWDQFWDRTKDDDAVFGFEFQNEAAAHSFNAVSPGFQTRNPNRPWVGTSYSDSDPAYASGSYPALDLGRGPMGDLHPSRRYPSHILDCCPANNIYFKDNRAVLIGEPDRYGWNGNPDARQAELSANAARAGAVMSVFHSKRGMRCELFDPETAAPAAAWFGAFGDI